MSGTIARGQPHSQVVVGACSYLRGMDLDGWYMPTSSARAWHGWASTTPSGEPACRYGTRVIGLSAPLTRLHSEYDVGDTFLHEIAHARVGPGHAHDPVWQAKAREVGCSASRCLPEDVPKLPAPWLGVSQAGQRRAAARRPERVASCRACASAFSPDHLFQCAVHGRPGSMHPNYLAELCALQTGAGQVPGTGDAGPDRRFGGVPRSGRHGREAWPDQPPPAASGGPGACRVRSDRTRMRHRLADTLRFGARSTVRRARMVLLAPNGPDGGPGRVRGRRPGPRRCPTHRRGRPAPPPSHRCWSAGRETVRPRPAGSSR